MHGLLYGYGNIKWDDSVEIKKGDVLKYDEERNPTSYVQEGNSLIGKNKIEISNVCKDEVLNTLMDFGNILKSKPINSFDIFDRYYNIYTKAFRYYASGGSYEEGFCFAARQNELPSRFILGTRNNENAGLSHIEKGLALYMDGSAIRSFYKNASVPFEFRIKENKTCEIRDNVNVTKSLKVNNSEVITVNSFKSNMPSTENQASYIKFPNGITEVYATISVNADRLSGTSYLDINDLNINPFNVQLSCTGTNATVNNTANIKTKSSSTVVINYNFSEEGKVYVHIYGY